MSICFSAQNPFFKAIVVDDLNSPIPYAHVEVVESSYKTVCDENGVFSIDDIHFPLNIKTRRTKKNISSENRSMRYRVLRVVAYIRKMLYTVS